MTFWRHEDALAALDEQIPVEGGDFLEVSIPLDRSKKQNEERPTTRKDRHIPSDKREKETSKQPASNNTQARNKPQPRPAKVEFIELFSRFVYFLALDLLSCFLCYNQTAVLNSASVTVLSHRFILQTPSSLVGSCSLIASYATRLSPAGHTQ